MTACFGQEQCLTLMPLAITAAPPSPTLSFKFIDASHAHLCGLFCQIVNVYKLNSTNESVSKSRATTGSSLQLRKGGDNRKVTASWQRVVAGPVTNDDSHARSTRRHCLRNTVRQEQHLCRRDGTHRQCDALVGLRLALGASGGVKVPRQQWPHVASDGVLEQQALRFTAAAAVDVRLQESKPQSNHDFVRRQRTTRRQRTLQPAAFQALMAGMTSSYSSPFSSPDSYPKRQMWPWICFNAPIFRSMDICHSTFATTLAIWSCVWHHTLADEAHHSQRE